jgi:hypothetical protein
MEIVRARGNVYVRRSTKGSGPVAREREVGTARTARVGERFGDRGKGSSTTRNPAATTRVVRQMIARTTR